ncbi:MAG TPA: cyclase family protein [Thermodesulfobacteriota bacterium]|nr:cyclase family protein [Thermodesulfobacteriota bacterium]
MTMEEMAKRLTEGRIIDLSKKVSPGKAEGPLDTGKRKYEINMFTFPPGELMHFIDMESHISTHIEAPSHFVPVRHPGKKGEDISELALIKFFGIAILVDCKNLPAKTPIGKEVLERFEIKENDIVLIGRCPYRGEDRCYLVKEGVEYLLQKKIKMVGVDDTVFPENPLINRPRDLNKYFTHDLMLSNGIPIIEGLANLEELKKSRFLFFGIPAKMGGLESFPIRAVAIEDN